MGGLIGMLLAAKPGSPIRRLVLNDVGPLVPWNALISLKGELGRGHGFARYEEAMQDLREACAGFGRLRTSTGSTWRAHRGLRHGDDGSYHLRYDPAISRGAPRRCIADPEMPIRPLHARH